MNDTPWRNVWGKKSCRYESEDIFWFDSHLCGAAIKGWFTSTGERSYNFTDKRVNGDNYMWPGCNYSLPVQHSQGGRRLDVQGGRDSGVTSHLLGMRNHFSCSLTPNICLLLFSHGDLEGWFFFFSCGIQVKAHVEPWPGAKSEQPQAPFICHLAITTPPRQGSDSWSGHRRTRLSYRVYVGFTQSRRKKKKIQSRRDWQLPHRLMCSGGFTRQGQTETGVFQIKSSPSEKKKSGYLQLWWERFFGKGIFVMRLSIKRSIAH